MLKFNQLVDCQLMAVIWLDLVFQVVGGLLHKQHCHPIANMLLLKLMWGHLLPSAKGVLLIGQLKV